MTNYRADAENLFRNFAQRHLFAIEKMDEPGFEVLMRVPQQPGLSLELRLGLQNNDELNIGFDQFWSYWFPYESMAQRVSDALDAIATGECRLAVYRQRDWVVKRVLERRFEGRWRTIYTEYVWLRIPFLRTEISYVYNEDARPF